MKNTNSKEFKQDCFQYLIGCMYDVDDMTDKEKVKHFYDKFNSEFNYANNRKRYINLQDRFAQYLAGLPINIDYGYADITETAERLHGCKLTDKQAEQVRDNWFKFMGFKCIQMFKAYGLPDLH